MIVNYQTMLLMVFRDKLTVNHQFMVIDGIWALYDFTPSLDGKRWYLGIRWLSTIKRWFLMVFRDKLTVNHQFMVINTFAAEPEYIRVKKPLTNCDPENENFIPKLRSPSILGLSTFTSFKCCRNVVLSRDASHVEQDRYEIYLFIYTYMTATNIFVFSNSEVFF